ncbi:MAG: DUF2927 domain-containing protein [Pseudomonadota bacterium]
MIRAATLAVSAAALLALAGCDMVPPAFDPVEQPVAAPAMAVAPAPAAYTPSPRSQRLRAHYARLQADQRTRGLLRTDSGAIDAPFTDRELAENFVDIALFNEHPDDNIKARGPAAESQLRRWEGPVRVALRHGASVDAETRAQQVMQTQGYVARLAQVSGHPINFVEPGAENFTIFVVDEEERRALRPTLRALVPGISANALGSIETMPRSVSCLVVAFSNTGRYIYTDAIAIIRAEHPPALWRSCLHEEVAQGLGLPNDSFAARPSIFNDDEEFALLTGHDEHLLSILYDPRLSPGMSIEEATPLVRAIAAEKMDTGPILGDL